MPGSLYYFDANPLICAADALIANPSPYDTKVSSVVLQLIEGSATAAISEITLLEVHSTICDHWRDTNRPYHDALWAGRAIDQLMAWLADEELEVLPMPAKLPEKAMVNMEEITRRTGLQLRAWDATHLIQAVNWSREQGARVCLVSADQTFERVLAVLPEFAPFIELLDPGT